MPLHELAGQFRGDCVHCLLFEIRNLLYLVVLDLGLGLLAIQHRFVLLYGHRVANVAFFRSWQVLVVRGLKLLEVVNVDEVVHHGAGLAAQGISRRRLKGIVLELHDELVDLIDRELVQVELLPYSVAVSCLNGLPIWFWTNC